MLFKSCFDSSNLDLEINSSIFIHRCFSGFWHDIQNERLQCLQSIAFKPVFFLQQGHLIIM